MFFAFACGEANNENVFIRVYLRSSVDNVLFDVGLDSIVFLDQPTL